MKIGSALRLRNFRNYGPDGRSWVEYTCVIQDEKTGKPKREKADAKEVFVALLLGTEPLVLDEKRTSIYGERLEEALRGIGFMAIDEAIAAGADPKKFKFEVVDNWVDGKSKET